MATEQQLVSSKDGTTVEITDTNAVHKTGAETIEGNKTFTEKIVVTREVCDYLAFERVCPDVDITVTPSSTKTIGLFRITDVNGLSVGKLSLKKKTDGKIQLVADLRNVDGTEKRVVLAESD